MEDCKVVNSDSRYIKGYKLHERDNERVKRILDSVVRDGQIAIFGEDTTSAKRAIIYTI